MQRAAGPLPQRRALLLRHGLHPARRGRGGARRLAGWSSSRARTRCGWTRRSSSCAAARPRSSSREAGRRGERHHADNAGSHAATRRKSGPARIYTCADAARALIENGAALTGAVREGEDAPKEGSLTAELDGYAILGGGGAAHGLYRRRGRPGRWPLLRASPAARR